MKRILLFLLCIAVLIGLYACGSGDEENVKSTTAPAGEKGGIPSDALIREDLEAFLSQINGYAELTDMEIQKSMTEESEYEITLTVNAETKYADWVYEMELIYRKYDQGWMLDESAVLSTVWQQVRTPDTDTMVEYASGYLAEHEVYSDTYCTEYMLPMENVYLQEKDTADSENTVLYFHWTGLENLKHAYRKHSFDSYWEYDPLIDNWVLCLDDSTGSLGYHLDCRISATEPNTSLDFSGTWDNSRSVSIYDVTEIFTISNFSWESFDAEYIGKSVDSRDGWVLDSVNISGHFTRLNSADSLPDGSNSNVYDVLKTYCSCVYSSENGEYIGFEFYELYTTIHFANKDGSCTAIKVSNDLPELN